VKTKGLPMENGDVAPNINISVGWVGSVKIKRTEMIPVAQFRIPQK
jgi:hypothetical protein